MKILIVTLAIGAGIILAPIQMFYCLFFSGKHLAEYDITPNQSVAIPLSPEMNPVRFNAKLAYKKPHIISGLRDETRYKASLRDGDKELWSKSFGVEVEDDDDEGSGISISSGTSTTSTSIQSFTVDAAKQFEFLAKETNHQDIRVESITLNVRRNVRQVVWQVAAAGGGLILFGILFAIFGGRGQRNQASREPTPIDPTSPFE